MVSSNSCSIYYKALKTLQSKNPNKTELKKSYIYFKKTIVASNVLITLLVITINGQSAN